MKMHPHDLVDMFPMLDHELDLNIGEISSPTVIRIFPSQSDQLIARNIRQFMQPDSSREQAVEYVQQFLKRGGHDVKANKEKAKVERATSVTEIFYMVWQDSFDPPDEPDKQEPQVPSAPAGPSLSFGVFTRTRAANQEVVTPYGMASMLCNLRVKTRMRHRRTSKSLTLRSALKSTLSDAIWQGMLATWWIATAAIPRRRGGDFSTASFAHGLACVSRT